MTTLSPLDVSAYKSPKKDELYLFVPQGCDLQTLPNELLVMFGEPSHVIDFTLDDQRKMARANPHEVHAGITQKGYYIQMPPTEVEKLGDMAPPPEHLDNIV